MATSIAKNRRIANKEKFVYKNINTGAYYPSNFESDTFNIYDAHVFSSNSFLVLFSKRIVGNLDWDSDKYGRLQNDYIRVNFNEEVKELRKTKLKKLNA